MNWEVVTVIQKRMIMTQPMVVIVGIVKPIILRKCFGNSGDGVYWMPKVGKGHNQGWAWGVKV